MGGHSAFGRNGLFHFSVMMTEELKEQLRIWAHEYHKADFIESDPVQFPHRYSQQRDIEIMGLLTALNSFGHRSMILQKVNELDELMGHAPLTYLLSCRWKEDFVCGDRRSFYRMLSYGRMHEYMDRLYEVYSNGMTLEEKLLMYEGNPMQRLCSFLEVSAKSPQKKLNMFLRWMIRRNSAVDFGIWTRMSPADLIIPLDTHVCRVAHQIGLTDRETFTLGNAMKITVALSELFPDDPCMGDFALFGYGVSHKNERMEPLNHR